MPHNFRNLKVYQDSLDLATIVLKSIESFPQSQIYILGSQLSRSMISIASNIAEGSGRTSNKEFSQYLSVSFASALEAETQIRIAQYLGYFGGNTSEEYLSKLIGLQKMIFKLREKIQSQIPLAKR